MLCFGRIRRECLANPKPVADAGIDLEQLQDWHDFCRIKGLHYDRVLEDAQMTLRDALTEVAAAGRATPRHDGQRWGVTIDRPQEFVVDHISPRNSREFKSSRSYFEPPHAMRVKFQDASNEYKSTERLVRWPGYEGPITRTEALELPGKTDATEVAREATRRMFEAMYRPDSHQVMQDGPIRVATRGDLVMLSHDVLDRVQVAARVKAVSGHIIEIDEEVLMLEEETYAIRFRVLPAAGSGDEDTIGTSVICPVRTDAGYRQILTLDGSGPIPVAGDLVHFGPASSESMPMIVSGVEAAQDFASLIRLVDASPVIDELTDAAEIPAWSGRIGAEIDENLVQPSAPRFASIRSGVSGTGVANQIDFLIEAGSGTVQTASFEVSHRLAGLAWTIESIPAANGGGSVTAYAGGAAVELRARGLSPAGVYGPYSATIAIVVGADDAGIPAALDDDAITVTNLLGGALVQAATGSDVNTSQIQVYRSMSPVLDRETDAVGEPYVVAPFQSYSIALGDTTRSNLLGGSGMNDAGAWTLDAGWAIAGGLATHTPGTTDAISQDLIATAGKYYRLGYVLSGVVAGTITPQLSGGSLRLGTTQLVDGSFSDRIQAVTGNDTVAWVADASFDGSLDEAIAYLETTSCLDQGTHFVWLEPQNEDGVPGPLSGPFTATVI
jgi:hypothetical protein